MPGQFQDSAVAFLDVLGFKRLITEAEASPAGFQRLLALKTVLDAHVRFDNLAVSPNVPPQMHPKYIFVSDSIIISAPLHYEKYDGLDIVVVKCIQVAQKIFELGHLVRGGVSVGSVWHDHLNIFGSGYIDAYLTEQQAVHPRIMLSAAASQAWQQPSRAVPELCRPDGKNDVVDTLHVAYLRTNAAGIPMEDYFMNLRASIAANLQDLPLGSEPRSKWEWMAGFFNSALTRHGLSNQPFASLPIPD